MTSERNSRKCRINDEIQLSNDSDAINSGWAHYLYYAYVFMHPCTYLLTNFSQNRPNQCFGDWPVMKFPDFSANDLSSVPLPLKIS